MSHADELQRLTLGGLAHRCTRETERFFRDESYDPRYCFELFRRAILDRNERAWELVYRQYCPLVISWVERHSALPASDEETQYFVNRAFEKMWSAVPPEKFDRFPNLKSLLRYLQMCVHSAIVDEVRSPDPPTVDTEDEGVPALIESRSDSIERRALTRAQREDFWQSVNERLKNEKERVVVHGSFVLALKPRELHAEYPSLFDDVTDIYRIKQNVMSRFRRDDELQKLLVGDA